jgi:hypothetical protein
VALSALDFDGHPAVFPAISFESGVFMADRKEPKEIRGKAKPAAKHFSESSPNPHGESKILQMPVRTHQRNQTGGKNIPQVPNTVGGNLDPSVAHEFQGRAVSNKTAPDKRTRAPKPVTEIKRKDA